MRSWSQDQLERARALDPESDVVWLTAETTAILSRPHATLGQAGLKAGQATAYLAGGLAISAMMPGTALAPVGQARAASEPFRLAHPPAITSLIPITPPETAAVAAPRSSFELARDEVEQFLRFGSREIPRPIVNAIVKAAAATKVDPIYLMALADKESAFRADVKAPTSSATGLYQFIDRTWFDVIRRFGADHGLATEAAAVTIGPDRDRPIVEDEAARVRILALRSDPYLSAVMAAEMLKKDAEEIGLKIGRNLNTTELYLAHFLGLEDAIRFLQLREEKTPQNAVAVFPAAARANVAIFYGPARRGRKGRWTRPGLTIPEVYARIQGMMDPRMERFGPVKVYAEARPAE